MFLRSLGTRAGRELDGKKYVRLPSGVELPGRANARLPGGGSRRSKEWIETCVALCYADTEVPSGKTVSEPAGDKLAGNGRTSVLGEGLNAGDRGD
jgi:hypothetical protein